MGCTSSIATREALVAAAEEAVKAREARVAADEKAMRTATAMLQYMNMELNRKLKWLDAAEKAVKAREDALVAAASIFIDHIFSFSL